MPIFKLESISLGKQTAWCSGSCTFPGHLWRILSLWASLQNQKLQQSLCWVLSWEPISLKRLLVDSSIACSHTNGYWQSCCTCQSSLFVQDLPASAKGSRNRRKGLSKKKKQKRSRSLRHASCLRAKEHHDNYWAEPKEMHRLSLFWCQNAGTRYPGCRIWFRPP